MSKLFSLFAVLVLFLSLAYAPRACAAAMTVSWYESGGKQTASGKKFDPNDPTIAAHPTLPFETILQVTNPQNGKSIEVIVYDRGPFISGRSLDVSRAAAQELGFLEDGLAVLDVRIISIPD